MASFNLKRFIRNPKKGLENAFRSVGKVNKDIAPYVGMIPGVGPALGAATGAWGSVLSGGNMKSHLKSGIQGGMSGYANQQAGGQGYRRLLPGGGNIRVPKELDMGKIFPGLPGMPSPNPTFPSSGGGGFDWANVAQTLTGGNRGGGGSGGFDWGKLLGGAGSFLKNNAVDIGIGGLAGYQALNAAKASKRAGQLQDRAISGAEKRWGDNEALRTEGRRRLLNPTRPDLSSVYNDPTNPFAQRPPPIGAAPPAMPHDVTPSIPVGDGIPQLSGRLGRIQKGFAARAAAAGPNVNPIPVPLGGQPFLPPPGDPGMQPYDYPQGVPKGIPHKRLLPAPY